MAQSPQTLIKLDNLKLFILPNLAFPSETSNKAPAHAFPLLLLPPDQPWGFPNGHAQYGMSSENISDYFNDIKLSVLALGHLHKLKSCKYISEHPKSQDQICGTTQGQKTDRQRRVTEGARPLGSCLSSTRTSYNFAFRTQGPGDTGFIKRSDMLCAHIGLFSINR